jgi:hypothetical protein
VNRVRRIFEQVASAIIGIYRQLTFRKRDSPAVAWMLASETTVKLAGTPPSKALVVSAKDSPEAITLIDAKSLSIEKILC